jgi:hypothetical protein
MINTGQCPARYATNSFSATYCLDCNKPLPWTSALTEMQKQVEVANQAAAQVKAQLPSPQDQIAQNIRNAQAARAQNSPRGNAAAIVAPGEPLRVNVFHVFADAFVGRFAEALHDLDKSSAVWFGLFCTVVANICMAIGIGMIVREVATFFQSFMPFGLPGAAANPFEMPGMGGEAPAPSVPSALDVVGMWRLVLVAFVPWLSVALCCTGARKLFGGEERHLEGDVFVAGVTLLPFGLFILLAGMLGFGQWRITALLSVFALTYTILLLYRGLTTVSLVRDMAAAFCVPLVLILSSYLTYVVFSYLM